MWKKRWRRVLLGVTVVIVLVGGGTLFWLTRPHYAWLTFGPKERVRVLVCDRGLWVTVTRFVDDKQQGPVLRGRELDVLEGLALHDPDGQTTYAIASVSYKVATDEPQELFVTVDIDGPVSYRQYCDASLTASDTASASVEHFHGPLTVGVVTVNWKLPDDLGLQRGKSPTSLRAVVGTMDESRGCWVVVSSHDENGQSRFAEGVRPEVEIAFPAQSAGQPPIVERYVLDQVCCGAVFYGPVPVPETAGDGLARVSFSFPSWRAGQVARSTVELPIVPAASERTPDAPATASR